MGKFSSCYRDLGGKNRDLGNLASPASLMNTSIFLQRKDWRGEISETETADLLTKRSSVNKDAMTIFQWTSKIAMSNLRSILINTFSERKVCKDENLAIVLAYNLFIHPSSSRDPARAVKRFTRTN